MMKHLLQDSEEFILCICVYIIICVCPSHIKFFQWYKVKFITIMISMPYEHHCKMIACFSNAL